MISESIDAYQSKIGTRESSLLYNEHIERTLLSLDNIKTSGTLSRGASILSSRCSLSEEIQKSIPIDEIIFQAEEENSADVGVDQNASELCELNDQFAHYIERVHFLEAENKSLVLELDFVEKNVVTYNTMVQNMIEKEIKGIFKMIDNIHYNRSQIDKEIADKKNAQDQYNKTISESKDEDLKLQLNEQLNNIASTIAKNESTCNLLKRKSADIDDKIITLKKLIDKLNSKLLYTVELGQHEKVRNRQQQEKKTELTRVLCLRRREYTDNLRNVNKHSFQQFRNSNKTFMDGDLSKLIKDMRDDHDRNIEQRKKELKHKFRADYQEMLEKRYQVRKSCPENKLLMSTSERQNDVSDHLSQIKLQMKMHELQRDVSELTANNIALHDTLQKLNQMILNDQHKENKLYASKQLQLHDLNEKLKHVTEHCQQISDTNATIADEIQNYRCLLEGSDLENGLKHFVENVEDRFKTKAKL
ncbi:hypothetical protein GJ496_008855 [Pomphorhynchus laevis]|nr:hypothetical protein GJ496_008855 [Pomphorhynchus laevis]